MHATTEPPLTLGEFEQATEGYFVAPDGPPRITRTIGQQAMQSSLLPRIYERFWRPLFFRAAVGGVLGATDTRRILNSLEISGDVRVLDVACGPGNTTRPVLDLLGPGGSVIGLDAAPGMLAQAVHDTDDARCRYVLGDAAALPFPDSSFDAVLCLGALHLMDDPEAVVAELLRVLAPGGTIGLLVTVARGSRLARPVVGAPSALAGVRLFGPDEFPDRLSLLGLTDVHAETRGLFQAVTARRPERSNG